MEEKKTPSIEDYFKRLNEIIAELESGERTLEESLKLYEEGAALLKASDEILKGAETRLRILSGEGETDDF